MLYQVTDKLITNFKQHIRRGKRHMADKAGLEMQGYERKVSTVSSIPPISTKRTITSHLN
jgi:hypothetical protein